MRVQGMDDVKIFRPATFRDPRGSLAEVYSRRRLGGAGVDIEFVQENHICSPAPGTVRGLHFQAPPFVQTKLVRVTRGAVLDVALDLRKSSPTYGAHVAAKLSAEGGEQMLTPAGFAHGFMTLEADTEVICKLSAYHEPMAEGGVLWNDADLGIAWPLACSAVSEADKRRPRLRDLVNPF